MIESPFPNNGRQACSKDNQNVSLSPQFQPLNEAETIKNHIDSLKNTDATEHGEILTRLLDQFQPVDFQTLAFPEIEKLRNQAESLETVLTNPDGSLNQDESRQAEREQLKAVNKKIASLRLSTKHYLILAIEEVLKVAKQNKWNVCKNLDFIYIFNGAFWKEIDKDAFQKFLGEASEKLGVRKFDARYFQFRDLLFRQFLSTAYLPTPEQDNDRVLINLQNGTFEITPTGNKLKPFNANDFITYQLPFEYDPAAVAPQWQKFLDRVLPDKQSQMVLAEYLGFIFIKNGSKALKEEKALILYGSGANGKSVVYEVVNALLGKDNVSSFSLQSLTNESGYYRAKIANILVNYASEINGQLETSIFKQMTSGEPIEARLPYGKPMTLTQYAKLIFNANQLPAEVEHSNAYFRRFLIIPFDVTIPEAEQDKQLHSKIINSELSGVFNWVLDGLQRLLKQKRFSECPAAAKARQTYEKQSDTAQLFLDEMEYQKSSDSHVLLKDLYTGYRNYCLEDGFKPLNKMNFRKRLDRIGVVTERNMYGNVVFITNSQKPF